MADQPVYKPIEKVEGLSEKAISTDATKTHTQNDIQALNGESPGNGDFQRVLDETSAKNPETAYNSDLAQSRNREATSSLDQSNLSVNPQNPNDGDFQRVMNQTLIENPSLKPARRKTLSQDSLITQVNQSENQFPVENLSNSDTGSRINVIRGQIQNSLESIGDVRTRLVSPSLGSIPNAYNTPLRNRLRSFSRNVNILSDTRVGNLDQSVTNPLIREVDGIETLPKPVQKFINLLTEGQGKLEALDYQLSMMGEQEMSHKDILSIQLKMGHISHELELFSSLLNKAIESTKTIMNVQV